MVLRWAFFVGRHLYEEIDMNETLQEYVDSRGQPIQVDRQRGVIRGVKILGIRRIADECRG